MEPVMKIYRKSAFIFRRDLRIHDNLGLIKALNLSEKVIPCFILDPDQIEDHPYMSIPGFGFMIESLRELDSQLKSCGSTLSVLKCRPYEAVTELIDRHGVSCIFVNADYTPFSIERDRKIEEICISRNVVFESCHDLLLNEPLKCRKNDGKPYTVFTPYFRNAVKIPVPEPQKPVQPDFFRKNIGIDTGKIYDHLSVSMAEMIKKSLTSLHFTPGRSNALKILEHISNLKKYETERDFPFKDHTTGLSAHLKFGTCSVREVYHAIAVAMSEDIEKDKHGHGLPVLSMNDNALIRQLYWRDFYSHIAFFFSKGFRSFFSA
jgi:deoxyribodipyrimidine photo-lyase